jgi:hypothetical protein
LLSVLSCPALSLLTSVELAGTVADEVLLVLLSDEAEANVLLVWFVADASGNREAPVIADDDDDGGVGCSVDELLFDAYAPCVVAILAPNVNDGIVALVELDVFTVDPNENVTFAGATPFSGAVVLVAATDTGVASCCGCGVEKENEELFGKATLFSFAVPWSKKLGAWDVPVPVVEPN